MNHPTPQSVLWLVGAGAACLILIAFGIGVGGPGEPDPRSTPSEDQPLADPQDQVRLDQVAMWRRRMVEGEAVVAQSADGGVQSESWTSLGPVSAQDEALIGEALRSEADGYRRAIQQFPPERSLSDVLERSLLSLRHVVRRVCLDQLSRREYVTLPVGQPRPPLPDGATWWGWNGGSEVEGQKAYVLFLVAPGDDPAFDDAMRAYRELDRVVLEERAAAFNNRSIDERLAAIRLHDQALEAVDRIEADKTLDSRERKVRLDAARRGLLPSRLVLDRARAMLVLP